MATYSEIQNTIANEMDREDLRVGGQIASAVKAAIKARANERFWFNETRSYTFTTTADDDTYSLAADTTLNLQEFITIDYIEVQVGSQWERLDRETADEMARLKESAHTGQPEAWSYFGDEIQLYPTPNDAYTVRVAGHFKFAELSADDDTNAWLTHGLDVIKEDAKAILFATVIRNYEAAAASREASLAFYAPLAREHSRRTATGRIKPWC